MKGKVMRTTPLLTVKEGSNERGTKDQGTIEDPYIRLARHSQVRLQYTEHSTVSSSSTAQSDTTQSPHPPLQAATPPVYKGGEGGCTLFLVTCLSWKKGLGTFASAE